MNSFLECLAAPSAILLGIETAERLICEVRPYSSSLGNRAVSESTCAARSMAFFQPSRSLCVLTVFPSTDHPSQITHHSSSLVAECIPQHSSLHPPHGNQIIERF